MSVKKYITEGEGLPTWSNPISHAVVVNNMCFISGQLAIDSDGIYVEDTIQNETNLAFSNFFFSLAQFGF
mgnify:FL=1